MRTASSATPAPALSALSDALVCPDCAGALALRSEGAVCTACQAVCPLDDGILVMTAPAPGETEPPARDTAGQRTREAYEQRYHAATNAARYNSAYREKLFKRLTTQREFTLLARLLGRQPHSQLLLDLPCGGGRLSAALAPFADTIIEADVAVGQVRYARQHSVVETAQVWMTASALKIPLRDGSVDGSVCCRLCHHLPLAAERTQLVRELLRVSKRFVVLTYFDYFSVKNTIRRLRRPFNKKPPKMTMQRSELAALAAAVGARVQTAPWIAPLSSGHRYALLVKDD
jgi:SAM-dependent methyltransferase/uncharacterized protein YbaR (Trm112 family)